MGIYAVKTTASQEQTVADMIMNREESSVHAALAPDSVTSYVMVEADDESVFERILDEIPHARGMVQGQTSMAEVEHFLSPTPDVEGIAEGDIVELIAGPFKGEKAQVQRIDEVTTPSWRSEDCSSGISFLDQGKRRLRRCLRICWRPRLDSVFRT
jgi:transcriptional antiterminator NusG